MSAIIPDLQLKLIEYNINEQKVVRNSLNHE